MSMQERTVYKVKEHKRLEGHTVLIMSMIVLTTVSRRNPQMG